MHLCICSCLAFSFFWNPGMKKALKEDALRKAKALKLKHQSWKKDNSKTGPSKKPATKTPGAKKKTLKKEKGLTKANLDQLGSLSLDEKVKVVAESAETEEEAASALQQSMTKAEKNRCWSKHNTHLKNHPDEKKALEKATKTEKGLASALFLLRKEGKKYLSVKSKVSAEEILQKTEEWETKKEMLQRFSDQDFPRHRASGRVVWRQDPTTWDCYEYCDTKKFKKTVNVGRSNGRKAKNMSPLQKKKQAILVCTTKPWACKEMPWHLWTVKAKEKKLALAKAKEKPVAEERPNWLWKMGKWGAKKKKKKKKKPWKMLNKQGMPAPVPWATWSWPCIRHRTNSAQREKALLRFRRMSWEATCLSWRRCCWARPWTKRSWRRCPRKLQLQ